LKDFDFVSEDELVIHTTTLCTLDFYIANGKSAVHSKCPGDTLDGGSSVLAFGYLLNVYTNFDVVGAGEIGITPTTSGGGGGGNSTPEPSTLALLASGLGGLSFLGRTHRYAPNAAR
jgi:hypothetical protein